MTDALSHFFDLNYPLVQFAHGLAYFVMGLAVALQARHRSRLRLASSLGWLAIFGLLQALFEWGQLFVPLQAQYINHIAVGLLQVAAVLILAAGFMALFQFAVSLLEQRRALARRLALALGLTWLALAGGMGLLQNGGIGLWELYSSLAARYLLGIPAALLTAYALRVQALRQVRPFGFGQVYRHLQLTGVAFGLVAVFGGLFGPYAPFLPASVINQSLLISHLGVPVDIFRALAALLILWGVLGVLPLFELEVDRELERLAVTQQVMAEREEIGRTLHDGAIQMVYTAGLLVASLRPKVADQPALVERVDRAAQTIDEAISSLRSYMQTLREPASRTSLIEGLRGMTYDSRYSALLQLSLVEEIPAELTLSAVQTAHLLAIASEALSNCVRHAQACRAELRLALHDGQLLFSVTDDGVGFDADRVASGFGLRNMRDRARLLGGNLTVGPVPGGGTQVQLSMAWGNDEGTYSRPVGG